MENKLRMAVVGVGLIGQVHAACINDAGNMELAAVIDPDEETGRSIAEQYGCLYLKDASELAAHPEIDAVNICVPEEYHLAVTEVCAAAGKHVLLEKPIAKTAADAQRIADVCREAGVRLMVEHTIHFVDEYRVLKSMYEEGAIGDISQVSIVRHSWREDMDRFKGRVSILYYIAIHDLEAVQWITGKKIVRVFARRVDTMNVFGEEGFTILFELEGGACGTMNVGWQTPDGTYDVDRVFLCGSKGYIDYDQGRNPIEVDSGTHSYVMTSFTPIGGKTNDNDPYLKENVMFADAVMNGGEFVMNTDDAIYIIRVLEAIQRSAESGCFEEVK